MLGDHESVVIVVVLAIQDVLQCCLLHHSLLKFLYDRSALPRSLLQLPLQPSDLLVYLHIDSSLPRCGGPKGRQARPSASWPRAEASTSEGPPYYAPTARYLRGPGVVYCSSALSSCLLWPPSQSASTPRVAIRCASSPGNFEAIGVGSILSDIYGGSRGKKGIRGCPRSPNISRNDSCLDRGRVTFSVGPHEVLDVVQTAQLGVLDRFEVVVAGVAPEGLEQGFRGGAFGLKLRVRHPNREAKLERWGKEMKWKEGTF